MPKLQTIQKVLVIGSGPIVIGQAAEFDYSGTQACSALKEEGLEVILVNNNPATIMTDKTYADKVYFEPLTVETVTEIIKKERPDGLLATVGGQTGLNLALDLYQKGVLEDHHVKLLGTEIESIVKAEDRECFRQLMYELGEPVPKSEIVNSTEEAVAFANEAGYPIIIRPAYTLGGFGGGIAQDEKSLVEIVTNGLASSPIGQCLIEKSIAGYKEIEYEVMRDANDTCITVCNMENIDPVGVHTGDSIVVAPSQTITDKEYHMLRSSALKIIRALGIVGGCNIQFALDPHSSNYYLIEVNPRVSRSSALASKATGYPIAKIAAKLSIGYYLHELKNPVTGYTYASFEPALDYITVKMPRWPFDKFPLANRTLGTQMKATGEVMAIGRNLQEAVQKAVRSLELNTSGFCLKEMEAWSDEALWKIVNVADDRRFFAIMELLKRKVTVEAVHKATGIQLYFLENFQQLIDSYNQIVSYRFEDVSPSFLKFVKQKGFSDQLLAAVWNKTEDDIRAKRKEWGIVPSYKMVDTCSAEFTTQTAYYYSSWHGASDRVASTRRKIAIIGSGPIRIGQGIEFDYCGVHSCLAAQIAGIETILINNNPETVSTDFEVADTLYFEPLTFEDVMNVLEFEQIDQVILQFGGQTAINLAQRLENAGITILGSHADLIDELENRERFYDFLKQLGIPHVPGETAENETELIHFANILGFPILLRPSYVIGGSGMVILHNELELKQYIQSATAFYPILVDQFVCGKEAEVDVVTDGRNIFVPGIFEHIETAGVHSGDSIAITPPVSLTKKDKETILSFTKRIAQSMNFKGMFNIQFVIKDDTVYVLEINPRASRTVPIFSKITGINLIGVATNVLLGRTLAEQGFVKDFFDNDFFTVKAPVFSNIKLPGLDPTVSPIMKSTGEVIGISANKNEALFKALKGAAGGLPDLWKIKGSLYVDLEREQVEKEKQHLLQKWMSTGFNVIFADECPFEKWIKCEEKQIYFSPATNKKADQLQTAMLNRLHVWTHWQTCEAYLESLQLAGSKPGISDMEQLLTEKEVFKS
ncbi:carbamoyl phosphate synthase large subunit [Fictibacillus gelatini]|uniref:carbamoyl phosphate synthase large subunit n=1 Tax=Fictibacillus gelatini TaxID=225985 RepID=UPI000414055E|nr:carbamoyl phosphate synthase large subunit [Fictibacillus gelatini]